MHAMTLSLTTRRHGADIIVVELAGRITLGRDSGQIEAKMVKLLDEGTRKIVIDLSKVDYIDSTGIGKIAYCFGRITQSGAQAFRITRLDTAIKFFPDANSACADLATAQAPRASAS
jgi:anti-sigma B factor antagonist